MGIKKNDWQVMVVSLRMQIAVPNEGAIDGKTDEAMDLLRDRGWVVDRETLEVRDMAEDEVWE